MSQVREDQDSPWKEALELFFEPFLQLLYPDIHQAIDWSRRATFLDKELQKLTPDGSTGRRYADKLAQVWLHNGHECRVLIHVELRMAEDFNGDGCRDWCFRSGTRSQMIYNLGL